MAKIKVMMLDTANTKRYWREVEGRNVSFAGFDEYSFVLHRSPENPTTWRVSETATGLYFVEEPTPNMALKAAKSRLLYHGKIKLNKAIEDAHKRFKTLQLTETKQ